ncbi:MAG: hypothetical protein WCA12_22260, partial [Burkholderiales bacterium]
MTGALVNVAFMQHFDDVARGHFIVRRFERRYGSQAIRAAYMRVARARLASPGVQPARRLVAPPPDGAPASRAASV